MAASSTGAFETFLRTEGYACTVCTDVYSVDSSPKKPVLLSCAKHNLCLECFETLRTSLKTCPECRDPLTFKAGPAVANNQTIQAIDTATKLWKRLQPTTEGPSSSSSSSSTLPVEKPPMRIPQYHSNAALCEEVWNNVNIHDLITSNLNGIIKCMNWGGARKEFSDTFSNFTKEWVAIIDENAPAEELLKGIAYLKRVEGRWETHWTGITTPIFDPDVYTDVFISLLNEVKRRDSHLSEDNWQILSLGIFFDFHNESVPMSSLLRLISDQSLNFEHIIHRRHWGLQSEIIVYLYAPPGHIFFKSLEIESPFKVKQNNQSKMLTDVETFLGTYQLNALFRACSKGKQEILNYMQTQFTTRPQDFYLYMIDDEARGFVRFNRLMGGAIEVVTCELQPIGYADHFIQQFVEWAQTAPSYGKNRPATSVRFSSDCASCPTIRRAIQSYRDNPKPAPVTLPDDVTHPSAGTSYVETKFTPLIYLADD